MKTYILLFFVTLSFISYAQIQISYGPEVGINSSGIPQFDSYTNSERNSVFKGSFLPLVLPKVGGFISLQAGNHFFIASGINYRIVGKRNHTNQEEDNPFTGIYYSSDNYYQQTFHVISSPALIGYNFMIGNSSFQIFAGYVFNYFATGKHYELSIYEEENVPTLRLETNFNPLDENEIAVPAQRWNDQITLGIGMNITEKLNLTINGLTGRRIEYAENILYGWCATGWGNYYDNSDISILLRYNLNKKQ